MAGGSFASCLSDSLSRITAKKPEQLGKNELFGFVITGLDGDYVLTGFDDRMDCYSRSLQKNIWSTKQ